MVMCSGFPILKVIVLCLYYFQTTQCMNGAPKGKGEALLVTDEAGKPLGVATPMVHGDKSYVGSSKKVEQHLPSGDMEKYFYSVKQLRKPSPGLYKEHLDNVMVNTQSEKPGSSDAAPSNPYWATMWAKDMWEEFKQLNQDHDNLINAIEHRKVLKEKKNSSYDYDNKVKRQQTQKLILTKQAKDLKFVLNSLNDYIEVSFRGWAWQNRVNPAFFSREFASVKKTSEDTRSVSGLENIRLHFPMKELTDISEALLNTFSLFDFNEDKQVITIKRIYIQTVELVYKHDLLDEAGFKNLFVKWCRPYVPPYASPNLLKTQYMFQHFYHSGKEQKNNIFENGKTLLTSRHSSPFLNMFKVDPESKTNLLYIFLKFDVEKYPMGDHLIQREAEKWKECFFQGLGLLFALRGPQNRYVDVIAVEKNLMNLIGFFVDPQCWVNNWRKSEDLKLMGQILEFVDENFLKTQPQSERTINKRLQDTFEKKGVRKRLNLMFSRIQALQELESFKKYLNESFPLKKKKSIEMPISPLQELEYIEYEIYNSKIQTEYRNNLTMKTEDLEDCQKEMKDKIKHLQAKINGLRKWYS
ncbi:hypothetical protein PGT21_029628 [Puccinia graminis f. sp. tritici]|uniref:Uncharacterized protein n=2 Tax=Puccinia graminis f. sp. tritici TaxID=56615 RepID=A0A5B0NZS5_PUCGR|nr:hypothetical protein PGT21_029628 [Puccinia graminis f. sp. tritici]